MVLKNTICVTWSQTCGGKVFQCDTTLPNRLEMDNMDKIRWIHAAVDALRFSKIYIEIYRYILQSSPGAKIHPLGAQTNRKSLCNLSKTEGVTVARQTRNRRWEYRVPGTGSPVLVVVSRRPFWTRPQRLVVGGIVKWDFMNLTTTFRLLEPKKHFFLTSRGKHSRPEAFTHIGTTSIYIRNFQFGQKNRKV